LQAGSFFSWRIGIYAGIFYGAAGQKYIFEHKQIGLNIERVIEVAVTVPAFIWAFRKYMPWLRLHGIAAKFHSANAE
jgi:hypothetical protein